MKKLLLAAPCIFCFLLLNAQAKYSDKADLQFSSAPGQLSVTHNSVTIGNERIQYTAIAGYAFMENDTGKLTSKIFFTYYFKEGESPDKRPMTFAFNGGPGSSSVWLHMGGVGPKRVLLDDDGKAVGPPYKVINNEFSWLNKTDLVFIDPVSTGFSSAATGVAPANFHGFEEDIRSVGGFIRYFLSRYSRWSSPKFLAGESYGTTRAAGLSRFLQDEFRIYLNGIVLISAILNFGTSDYDIGNDLPAALYVPSYTAAAWFHKKLSPELQSDFQKAIHSSEMFATGELAPALIKGDWLKDDEKDKLAEKLAAFTGLSKEFCLQNNLRITENRFYKELRRKDGLIIGRLDARFTGRDLDDAGESPSYDPSFANIDGPFTSAINDYFQRELKWNEERPYNIFGRISHWNYSNVENKYLDVAESLREAMTKNPSLKVFVGAGYYDFATPYFIATYDVQHMFLRPELKSHIGFHYYDAGHMFYIHKKSLVQFKKDVDLFYENASGIIP